MKKYEEAQAMDAQGKDLDTIGPALEALQKLADKVRGQVTGAVELGCAVHGRDWCAMYTSAGLRGGTGQWHSHCNRWDGQGD